MSRDLKRRQNKYGIDSGDIIVSPKLLAAQTAYKKLLVLFQRKCWSKKIFVKFWLQKI